MIRFALIISIVWMSGCHKKTVDKLGNDPKERESYSLGYQLGTSLKKQNMSINLEAYVSALRDGLEGAAPQVSQRELDAAVSDLRNSAVAAQQAKLRDQSDKNRAAGAAFLDDNRKREGINALPSGLQYKVLKDGTGRRPGEGDTVTVHYRSSLIDGTELSSSYQQGKPVTVGLGRVIAGWKEALQRMNEGAKWQLFVPSELAYGTRGSTGIGPNSTLVFDVELLRVGN
jgi:FKBP-type peptidyl-prolyl cis-trans isomerase FklB